MKKLFLTSGIIACMACPAFADPGFTATNGQIPAAAATGACVEPTLGVYSGPTRLTAEWSPTFHTITLISNTGAGSTTATGGAYTVATAGTNLNEAQNGIATYTNQTLFAATPTTQGDPAVYTGFDSDANLNGGVASGSSPFTGTGAQSAAGIDVNYILNTNAPQNHTRTDDVTAASSTAANRAFQGFYDSTYTTQYINGSNQLTSDGDSAARGASADLTWYAKYNLAAPTDRSDPSIDGYTFNGWATTQNGNVAYASTAALPDIGENTQYYAKWTPQDYTISFDCDFPATAANTSGPGTNPSDGTNTHSITMDSSASITETCSANGWTFTGWTCTSDAGQLYTAQDMQTMVTSITAQQLQSGAQTVFLKTAGNVSCTANWTAQTITINWDVNYATEGTSSQNTCNYGSDVTIPTAPERTGYEFTGWGVDASNGTMVSPIPQSGNNG